MVHPNNIHNGFSCDSSIDHKEFQDTLLYDAVVKFNWCNSFAYIEKTSSGGYFGFDFGTTKENYHIMNRLMNESKIVKKFIRQMHKRLHLLIAKDLQENAMDFYELKGDVFYSQQGIVFTPPDSNKDKMDFLKEAGLLSGNNEQYFLSNAVLSPQEVNCLRIYLAIPNIKQVARDLDLAVTTATSYIENIKCKLNCTNKNDLLEKAELLESLGCI
jgi:DNA-binding CsgD family transcriptional regulator